MSIDHDSGWREVTAEGARPLDSALGSLVHLHDRLEQQNRRLQVRIEEMERNFSHLRAELDLRTEERDRAVERLQRAGLI